MSGDIAGHFLLRGVSLIYFLWFLIKPDFFIDILKVKKMNVFTV